MITFYIHCTSRNEIECHDEHVIHLHLDVHLHGLLRIRASLLKQDVEIEIIYFITYLH